MKLCCRQVPRLPWAYQRQQNHSHSLRARTHKFMDNERVTFMNGWNRKVNAFVLLPPLSESRDDVAAGCSPVWQRAPCFYRFHVIYATVPSWNRYTLHVNSLSPPLSVPTPRPVTVKSYFFPHLFLIFIFPSPVTWAFRVQCELSTPCGLFFIMDV